MLTRANFLYSCGGVLLVLRLAEWFTQPKLPPTRSTRRFCRKRSNGASATSSMKAERTDGSYSAQISPAVTGICTASLLRSGRSPDDPAVAKSLKYLEGFVQKDGGIYKPDSTVQNYETSIAIMCFTEANKDGRYNKLIKNAENYVKNIQWGGDGKLDKSDIKYGGAGYGKGKTRPDLSNTSFLLDAFGRPGPTPATKPCNGAGVCLAMPEPRKSVQHDALCREESRWWFLLHPCRQRYKRDRRQNR